MAYGGPDLSTVLELSENELSPIPPERGALKNVRSIYLDSTRSETPMFKLGTGNVSDPSSKVNPMDVSQDLLRPKSLPIQLTPSRTKQVNIRECQKMANCEDLSSLPGLLHDIFDMLSTIKFGKAKIKIPVESRGVVEKLILKSFPKTRAELAEYSFELNIKLANCQFIRLAAIDFSDTKKYVIAATLGESEEVYDTWKLMPRKIRKYLISKRRRFPIDQLTVFQYTLKCTMSDIFLRMIDRPKSFTVVLKPVYPNGTQLQNMKFYHEG